MDRGEPVRIRAYTATRGARLALRCFYGVTDALIAMVICLILGGPWLVFMGIAVLCALVTITLVAMEP